MKKITVLLAFMVMIVSAPFAQTTNQKSEKERPSTSELLQRMDANNDGRLAKTEVKGKLAQHFDTIDANKDGYISQAELENTPRSHARAKKGKRERPTTAQIFEKLDSNKDGRLAKAEVKGRMAKHFDQVDSNSDGFITTTELENAPKPDGKREKPTVAQLLEKMDTNKDGRLAKAEVKGRMAKHFDQIDTNNDGFLSTDELENRPKRKGSKEACEKGEKKA